MQILMWRINFTFRNEALQSPVDRFCRWEIFGNLGLQQNKVCPLFNSSGILTTYAFTKIVFFFHSWPCAYCSRSRFVAHHALMILILSPLSVCDITSNEPEELSPRSKNQYSPIKGSAAVTVTVPVGLTGFIEFLAKNSPEGFGIFYQYWRGAAAMHR
jgi:hypothetical protein